MALSFRKSFGNSLFRVNVSKSGLSYSTGVKGARVTVGPKGTYVTFNSHGLQYRKKIGSPQVSSVPSPEEQPSQAYNGIHTITSADVDHLTDTDSKDFIQELTEKAQKRSYQVWFAIMPFLVGLGVLLTAFTASDFFWILAALLFSVFIMLYIWTGCLDKERFEMEIHYEMDSNIRLIHDKFISHFAELTQSSKKWQYLHASSTNDYKRTGGASKLINRIPIVSILTDQKPIRFFVTNVNIPHIKLRNTELYFLPERLLIKRDNKFAAVFYQNMSISGNTMRFIEEEGAPRDAVVVGQTWKYLNKKGGPDKRFNNNRQIPICQYSEYTIKSETGVYEIITTSKIGALDNFASLLSQIGSLQSSMQLNEH